MTGSHLSSLLATVRSLAPRIQASVAECEQSRRIPLPLVEAMTDAGLFRLWLPRSLGGDEADPTTVVRVIEEVSRIDGATGWCLMIAATTCLPGGYVAARTAREMFGAHPHTICAGGWPPFGEAVVVEDGYRVTGRWPLSSGCQHCGWFQAGCRVIGSNGPRLRADGTPVTRIMLLPATSCVILDIWHSAGLRGTGSNDFTVTDVFVPADHTVSFRASPVEPGPLYAFPTIALSAAAIAAVPLGIARHAIDILTEITRVKIARRSQKTLNQSAMVQTDLGRAEGLLRSGRAFLLEALDEAWHVVCAGGRLSVTQRAMLWLAATQATTAATQAVDLMFSAGGTASIYANAGLERCLRDIRTAGQHITLVPSNYEMAGQALLGFDMRTTPLLAMDDRSEE